MIGCDVVTIFVSLPRGCQLRSCKGKEAAYTDSASVADFYYYE